ncbi:MAG: response regulator [Acidobacteriota bacterium]
MENQRILVVDDDPSVLDTYRKLLRRCGYIAMTAENGTEVLRDLEKFRSAGLVILDYKMPVMDGLTLLVEMRKMKFLPKVILISAYLTDEIIRRAEVLGVAKIFHKPVDVVKLKQSIKEALEA